jgi:hypothetical protein
MGILFLSYRSPEGHVGSASFLMPRSGMWRSYIYVVAKLLVISRLILGRVSGLHSKFSSLSIIAVRAGLIGHVDIVENKWFSVLGLDIWLCLELLTTERRGKSAFRSKSDHS